MENKDKQPVKTITLPQGVEMALFTALGYLVVFAFKRGFYDYLNLPLDLIKLDLNEILEVGAITLAATCFVIVALEYYYAYRKKIEKEIVDLELSNDPYFIYLKGNAFWIVASLVVFVVSSFFTPIVTWLVIFVYGPILYNFAVPSKWFHKEFDLKESTYRDRFIEYQSRKKKTENFFHLAKSKGLEKYWSFFMLFLLASTFSYAVGAGAAKNRKEYLVSTENANKVLLDLSGDRAIFGFIDEENKLTNRISIEEFSKLKKPLEFKALTLSPREKDEANQTSLTTPEAAPPSS